ncbi:hypothetical protein TSHO111613_24700 [Tsukamurella hominis]
MSRRIRAVQAARDHRHRRAGHVRLVLGDPAQRAAHGGTVDAVAAAGHHGVPAGSQFAAQLVGDDLPVATGGAGTRAGHRALQKAVQGLVSEHPERDGPGFPPQLVQRAYGPLGALREPFQRCGPLRIVRRHQAATQPRDERQIRRRVVAGPLGSDRQSPQRVRGLGARRERSAPQHGGGVHRPMRRDQRPDQAAATGHRRRGATQVRVRHPLHRALALLGHRLRAHHASSTSRRSTDTCARRSYSSSISCSSVNWLRTRSSRSLSDIPRRRSESVIVRLSVTSISTS